MIAGSQSQQVKSIERVAGIMMRSRRHQRIGTVLTNAMVGGDGVQDVPWISASKKKDRCGAFRW